MAASNEAAERLLDQILNEYRMTDKDKRGLLDAALAAERRATVERIRAALEEHDPDQAGYRIWAILDAEAER